MSLTTDFSNTCEAATFKLHVGIDFGTDGTGLAYVVSNTTEVKVHDRWMVKNAKYGSSIKPKTALLIGDDESCIAFGTDAIECYLAVDETMQKKWMLFEHFKMDLYQRDGKSMIDDDYKEENKHVRERRPSPISMELQATNGLKYPASKVFVHAFNKIKNEVKSVLTRLKLKSIEDDEIQYILTVPAIWDETAKHFMKEWASESGLVDRNIVNQLKIVYEPDCASLSIQHRMKGTMVNNNNGTMTLAKGDKYILVDAGGGTCDIACHEILGDLKQNEFGVKEVLHPSGGAWGSIKIDKEFIKILNQVFSKSWMNEFRNESAQEYFQIVENFRISKESFFFDGNDSGKSFHNIRLPLLFWQFIEEKLENSDGELEIENVVKYCRLLDTVGLVSVEDEYLMLHMKVWKSMFDVVVEPIVDHCHKLLNEPLLMRNCKHLCLVGGLSCNSYFTERMNEEFGENSKYLLNIIKPERPMLSVVEGAALMGVSRNYIQARVLSKTYGISTRFPERYCKELGISDSYISKNRDFHELDDVYYVRKCFSVIARKNETIFTNQVFKKFYARWTSSTIGLIPILCSDKSDPLLESDGQFLAQFHLEFDEDNDGLETIVEFHFHDTMLRAFAYPENNPQNKKEVSLQYEFQ